MTPRARSSSDSRRQAARRAAFLECPSDLKILEFRHDISAGQAAEIAATGDGRGRVRKAGDTPGCRLDLVKVISR